MDCKEFREVLDLYIDRELSSEAENSARLHVNECSRCRRAEQQLRSLRRALKEMVAKNDPPLGLVGAVNKISHPWWKSVFTPDGQQRRTRLWGRQVTLPAPVFAVLLLFVLGLGALLVRRPASTAPTASISQNRGGPTAATSTEAATGAIDLSRFDQGGRVSLYKAPR